ncbi:hypothetical protein [Methanococcus maripaludis]|jgi:uncharacterized Zn finger protein|uniref:Uncharacterized protein n=2 Tax=Methanococcus maripaludis TaxID=39152 RepID=G0H1R2_METMI|nr:hypothetical protein [Methanococcus maripaludis]AEK19069.1 hypothetical protein GYY_00905 [Methanococcus maripaludis X1]CAF29733.1 conserved hypothetical archaeal protein [Methanococcus maripaludis S2]
MENWKLSHTTKCYSCGKIADQIIEIYPNQALVKCSNCNATRYYVIKKADIEDENSLKEEVGVKRKYDNWVLQKDIDCARCGHFGPQDILITENGIYIRCRHCGFTRYYRYHIHDPVGGK